MLNGRNISCIAYGQTGSGKTYTMIGDSLDNINGLYYFTTMSIFNLLENKQTNNIEVKISFYEIYNEKSYDLLNYK